MENLQTMSYEELKDLCRQVTFELNKREEKEKIARWKNLESAFLAYLKYGDIVFVDVSGDRYNIDKTCLDFGSIGIINNANW